MSETRLRAGIEIPDLILDLNPQATSGEDVLQAIVGVAKQVLGALQGHELPVAITNRLRGNGEAASFSSLIDTLERDLPIELRSPFESRHEIAGAVWPTVGDDAVLKLHFRARAVDLPLHTHEHSARFIVVLSGRGFFHCYSGECASVITRAVRSRDVLAFSSGLQHSFSAPCADLVLLSVHLPFIPLDDKRQFTVPHDPVLPRHILDDHHEVRLDQVWTKF